MATRFYACYSPEGASVKAGAFSVGGIMAQDFSREFYHSAAWKYCRASFMQHKRHLCERCLSKGIYRVGETVHHKTPLTPANINDPSITLGWDNLQLLCRDCHAAMHKSEKRYKVDELGRVTTI